MARKKIIKNEADLASPHTIKKFELIDEYVKSWAQKLLNYRECNGIVFIDCMCNSSIYKDNDGNEVLGTPIRVASYLAKIMQNYPNKQAQIYYNDLSVNKINLLKTRLPVNTNNFSISTRVGDGNALLKDICIPKNSKVNYLLVYDPFQATLDWEALFPFLRNWGEVIINHMVSDSIRGVSQAKNGATVDKYEQTYLAGINELTTFGSDRSAYEKRIKEIIAGLHDSPKKQYYTASFPFFNTKNALVYNLIHCSSNIEGFKLFKKTAWKIFGGKSSSKNTYGIENQLMLDFGGSAEIKTITDEYCYYVKDIVDFIYCEFKGKKDVALDEIWKSLDEHPSFPSEGFKTAIKNGLKDTYGCIVSKQSITFTGRRL